MDNYILILYFNLVNAKFVAKLLRSSGYYCTVCEGSTSPDTLDLQKCKGIIPVGDNLGSLSGIELDNKWLKLKLPVLALGSCAIAITKMHGGSVADAININFEDEIQTKNISLFENANLQSTNFSIVRQLKPGENMHSILGIESTCIAVKHNDLEIYGLQINIERNDIDTAQIINNFAELVCHCPQNWTAIDHAWKKIDSLYQKYPEKDVVCLVSGDVNGYVCASLMQRKYGDKLHCVLINTGFFHVGEVDETKEYFKKYLNIDLLILDEQDNFITLLEGIDNSDEKTKIMKIQISNIINNKVNKIADDAIIAFGTNYIEYIINDEQSSLAKIQSNNGSIVFTPVSGLFQSEVKEVARTLNIPDEVIHKQYFPNYGLSLRIYGAINAARLNMIQQIDKVFVNAIIDSGLNKRMWQYYTILSPSPIIEGTYIVILRAIQNSQNQNAYAYRLPYDLLESVTEEIRNKFPKVRHVMYDMTQSESFRLMA